MLLFGHELLRLVSVEERGHVVVDEDVDRVLDQGVHHETVVIRDDVRRAQEVTLAACILSFVGVAPTGASRLLA